ncbi:MAG: DUF5058 family protein, partial [Oscillospiraceae bacterium]
DKTKLRRSITASATFTVLPSISILLGVIALAGTLGIPLPWLRLSVVGALHYETTVADIAARSTGMSGLNVGEMSTSSFVTIALVMSVGIIWGLTMCIFILKKYLSIIAKKSKKTTDKPKEKGKSFGDVMMAALFIGLISAYLGSYLGTFTSTGDYFPLITVGISALTMAIFEFCQKRFKLAWLENFSVAASMLVGMTGTVLIGLVI